jgi:hypothetical protein
MFKPLPADPVLIQKLRIRNRVASLVCFGLFIGWPILTSFIQFSNPGDYEVLIMYSSLLILIGFANAALMIPASVFFFGHEQRYKKLLAYLGSNPAIFAATEPAPSDLQKLRSKKTLAIVWHSATLAVPFIWAAAAAATDFSDQSAAFGFVLIGTFLGMSALASGLVMSVVSINGYLSFKARLRWAFPDAVAFRDSSKNV